MLDAGTDPAGRYGQVQGGPGLRHQGAGGETAAAGRHQCPDVSLLAFTDVASAVVVAIFVILFDVVVVVYPRKYDCGGNKCRITKATRQ